MIRRLRSLLLLLALGLALSSTAQTQAPGWGMVATPTRLTGGWSEAAATATDAAGNVYVTGYFNGQLAFGNSTLTSAGGNDVFVAKWNPATATWVWARSGGGTGLDQGYDIAVSDTSVYVTGVITNDATNANSVQFDGTLLNGAGSITSEDVFVVKYDAAGTFQWGQSGGGTDQDNGLGIAASPAGVYVTGAISNDNANSHRVQFSGTPLNGMGIVSSGDVFVVKYTAAGAFQWAQTGGGKSQDLGYSIAVSGPNVYVTGAFWNSNTNIGRVQFGGTTLNGASPTISSDVFVAKYDDVGTFLWARSGGGTGQDLSFDIAVSGPNVYVGGYITNDIANGNSVQFSGTSLPGASPASSRDVMVAKYDDAGSLQWVRSGGGTGHDLSLGIAVSGPSVYVAGYITNDTANSNSLQFSGTFLPGASPTSSEDVFVVKYTDTGTFQWAQSGGGTSTDYGLSMAVSGPNVYVAGSLYPPAGLGSTTFSNSLGQPVAFVAALPAGVSGMEEGPLSPGGFRLWPNPAHTTVRLTGLPPTATTVAVEDALGRTVRTAHLEPQTSNLNLQGLLPGLYVVRAGGQSRRLVVE